ncbi:ribonuclease D [Microbacterium invictum]|uniref:HRDC domain-containing protein n=1 Tax=Microbacterium invictum TaxID=515415 RepID=A0ABZ0V726_9MICO|nr:HRDC domain-containing protein [Microbacterium invictum]WQB69039.1 HRDC domain-containing protein [Microbacterium invictum]
MAEYTVIADEASFARAVSTLRDADGPVAVDVERASGFRYSQRAYLIQVFRRGAGVHLFDPPVLEDFSPLQEAIGSAEWVLHAASQDLPSLRERGLEPTEMFDTELAARLLGHERVGLGAVVEDTLGISLAKAHSAADWSTRPLPDSWLEYAALDVVHLIDVRDALAAELAEQGKTEFARQEFAAVLAREPKPSRDDPWRRLSGLHTVRGRRALAVARALWTAREEYAREQDVAPGRLVPDRALVAAIRADPASKHELAGVKDFTGRASRSQLDRWWNAIQEGRATTDLPPDRLPSTDTIPPPRAWPDRNPAADARLKAARPVVEARAAELSMPTENLLTPELLRRVAWSPPAEVTAERIGESLASLGARAWQIDQTAQIIADAFVESVQSAAMPPESTS